MSSGRPLLAARTSSGEASKDGNSPGSNRPPPGGSGRQKRTLIESACSACRRRKSRCDGLRPTCTRCQNLRTDCHYEAEEGESRWSALRRRNHALETEREQLRELMMFLQTRSEHEALDIFQRIRQSSYDDLFLLLRQLKEGAMGMPANLGAGPLPTGSPSGDQRLPPIQTILDVPGHGMTPMHAMPHQSSMGGEESRNASVEAGAIPPGHPHHRSALDTLEPSLRQQQAPGMISVPTLSSEDSAGSTDPQQKTYHSP